MAVNHKGPLESTLFLFYSSWNCKKLIAALPYHLLVQFPYDFTLIGLNRPPRTSRMVTSCQFVPGGIIEELIRVVQKDALELLLMGMCVLVKAGPDMLSG